MGPFFFCAIFLIAMFLINVVLPVFVLYLVGRWVWRLIQGEKKGETNAVPAEELAAALARSRAETAAARAETETVRAAAAAVAAAASKERAQEEKIAVLKTEGNLDRLALVYYVEDALKSGQTAGDISAALRAKGWPEEEIAAAVPGGEESAPA